MIFHTDAKKLSMCPLSPLCSVISESRWEGGRTLFVSHLRFMKGLGKIRTTGGKLGKPVRTRILEEVKGHCGALLEGENLQEG